MDVVALGEALIDFTFVSRDGEGYPTMAAHPGGAPANFLGALAKYGKKCALMSKVGDDAFGHLLVDTLKGAGIGVEGVLVDPDVFTTLAFVTLDEKGDREFSFARKPGADTCLSFEELNLELIDKARVFHFGTLSLTDEPARSATYRAVSYAKEKGKLITYDPNLRKPLWKNLDDAKEQLLWGLGQADVVKISDEEVEFLFGLDPAAGAEHILKHFGVKLVFVTCGERGCLFQTNGGTGFVPALQVTARDTTGAGDIFGGSAVFGLLDLGKEPEEATAAELEEIVRFACTAAGISVTRPGGLSSVPTKKEVEEKMRGF